MNASRKILVTGGTGYVGGRLIPLLRDRGNQFELRLMARKPEYLRARVGDDSEIVAGDVTKPETLTTALENVDTAYYLIHSMGSGQDFEDQDRLAAQNFALAAKEQRVRRIVYLGGLGEQDEFLSKHLRSRHEVGEVLKESGAQVIEFRASIVIGSGSLSFELIRALVQKLPVMICPKWVSTQAQPIAIEDVLTYMSYALELPEGDSRVYDIGGPDQVSYGDLMREYARQRGLKRLMIPVPFLSARLSSLWLGLVTPVYATIGRKLVESLKNPTIVNDNSALEAFPLRPMSLESAIQRALSKEDQEFATTRWQDAVSSSMAPRRFGGEQFGNRLIDCRTIALNFAPETAFEPIQRIGGKTGWYYGNFLWRIRGFMDLLVGGPGLRRGRRHPVELNVGDTLDCWRVEKIDAPQILRLNAEMRLPGRAWLEFTVTPSGDGCEITQTAMFDPVGLFGLCYWYSIWPLHQFIFAGMLRRIGEAAMSFDQSPKTKQDTTAEMSKT
ncbi:MAG: SDR family oxidoreductase [Fuerstiella sp.]|nr:SDR family oxidoreductase [Fuerstiella sp.]